MKTPDPPAAIPAPTAKGKRFQVRDELTVYEAALVYADRHPYPKFFGLKDGRNSKREHMLTYLNLKRPWAQLARDIFYELGERIKRDRIKPIRHAYDPGGKIDLFRTLIRRADVLELVTERGDECPKYLRGFQTQTTAPRAAPKMTKREEAKTYIKENYPDGIPPGVPYKMIASDVGCNERTVRRALGRK